MAIEKQEVAAALRDASTRIATLTETNDNLEADKAELLQKVASLELQVSESASHPSEGSYLGKQASDSAGSQYLGFGSAEEVPGDFPLSADERMSTILSGEYID